MKKNIVEKFIDEHWKDCICYQPNDEGTIVGLPYPYSVPSANKFRELYYWDTYFTNLGLLASGRIAQAKNNVDNILFLVNKFGFMPNANRTYYLDRSQPPFLSFMVKDIFEQTKDKDWLRNATIALEKEYSFWMNERMTLCGLNHYGAKIPENTWDKRFAIFQDRIQLDLSGYDKKTIAQTVHAEAESGWDCTPRFEFTAQDYAPVDLNSLLYALEKNIALFSLILDDRENKEKYDRLAADRKKLMDDFLWCEEQGAYLDYNFVTGKFSPVFSAASYYPLFVGLADKIKADKTAQNLKRIEYPCGISACEKNDIKGRYQWNYPNAWAPIQFIVAASLENYGLLEDFQRIAEKYISMVEACFEATGNLWEKYNAEDGSINVTGEINDKMPTMMGWSAGVYLYIKKHCE